MHAQESDFKPLNLHRNGKQRYIKVRYELGFENVNISASDIYHQLGEFHGGNVFCQKWESK